MEIPREATSVWKFPEKQRIHRKFQRNNECIGIPREAMNA
jgi:hypothetical protein